MKKVTLLIPTYNRAESLQLTLNSIAGQDSPPCQWECVVVNNNSRDNTSECVETFIETHPSLDIHLLFEGVQGRSSALNCGIAHSQGEIIIMVDDDEELLPGFISGYIRLFEELPEVNIAGGVMTPRYIGERPKWMSYYTELPILYPINYGKKPRQFPNHMVPCGGNVAVKRSLFDKYGAFLPHLGRSGDSLIGGEEVEFLQRAKSHGEQIWYNPYSEVLHYALSYKLTPEHFQRLTYNIGVGQRLRSTSPLYRLLIAEGVKWCATLLIALFFIVTLRPAKSVWLIRMRCNITRGLLKSPN
ncbi:MAG: glycosyltransferase family 2 protein [Rikenellaceae bacterium]